MVTGVERLDESMVGEDLEFVVRRLVTKDDMPEDLARKIRPEYIRFMSLHHVTKEPLSPSSLVDSFWHAHILHTEQYEEFCRRYFGYFIHHRPEDHAAGMAGVSPGERTRELMDEHFPEHDAEIWNDLAMCRGNSTSYTGQ